MEVFAERRARVPAGTQPGSEPLLVERIRDEIKRSGPISFARFMELALYDPDFGYYRVARTGLGRQGDFLTAPETHPIFGAALAAQIHEAWERLGEPAPFAIREDGAGTGALAESILREVARRWPALLGAVTYHAVELNDHRRAELHDRLDTAGFGGRVVAVGPADGVPEPAVLEPAADGIVIANELLDALPVHRVRQLGGELVELFVDWSGECFIDRPCSPSTRLLADRLAAEGIRLAEGQHAEIALGIGAWFDEIDRWLGRGLIVIVDYGHPATVLYGPRHTTGMLLGYVGHRATDDPYANVGRQDLTTHVDLTAVELAAGASGFELLGSTTQAEFLMGLGIEGLLDDARSDPSLTVARYLELRSGLVRLLDPRATGGFRVLLFGRGLSAKLPLRGLSFRRPSANRG